MIIDLTCSAIWAVSIKLIAAKFAYWGLKRPFDLIASILASAVISLLWGVLLAIGGL